MVKAGTEYQELVALVVKALDPNAKVKTGQWIAGPDGNREIDVEVRGTINSESHFVLIECKDWKKPVDIQEIDKLDSKQKDLSADAAMIYSNSGFTKKALRKAERVGINVASAISSGNNLVRIVLEKELVVKALSIDKIRIDLSLAQKSISSIPENWDAKTLRYNGLPLFNWLQKMSLDLLNRHEGESKICECIGFKQDAEFTLEDVPIKLRGFRVRMTCSRKWLSQTVQEDASLGVYNHFTHRLTIPDKQYWSMGWISHDKWKEIEDEPEELTTPLEPGTFRLDLTLLNPIAGFKEEDTPNIDALIGTRQTLLE